MRNWDFENWVTFLITVAIAVAITLFVGGLLVIGGVAAWDGIADGRRKTECERRGGIVQHYDPKHGNYWRCTPHSTESP